MADRERQPDETAKNGLLQALGVFGFRALEPVVLAALAREAPLLLVGSHGTGKSFLLLRLAEALGLTFRHYNASLLSFDDLVGFPMPDGSGGIRYVPTAASIQGVEAVFLDEISRARPEVQNKLFSIIHERRVLGMPLASLRHRWSAMNPPAEDGDDPSPYSGTERLDVALADRFAFVCKVPSWIDLSTSDQERLLLQASDRVPEEGALALRRAVAETRLLQGDVRARFGSVFASYVRSVANLLPTVGFSPSPRRAVFLLENVVAVHAAELAHDPGARPEDSAFLALLHSLPAAATGASIPAVRLLPLHRAAWGERNTPTAPRGAPAKRRTPATPLTRVVQLAREGDASRLEFSAAVGEALVQLPPGGRHALAATLYEAGLAERLDGCVAEAWAKIFAQCASAAEVPEAMPAARDAATQAATVAQAAVRAARELGGEERWLANLLCSLFESRTLPPGRPDGASFVREAWTKTRRELWEADLVIAPGRAA